MRCSALLLGGALGCTAGPRPAPVFQDLAAASHLSDPWQDAVSGEVECPVSPSSEACRIRSAVRAASAGDLVGVGSACAGIEEGRWRGECFFQAADRHLVPGDPQDIDPARVAGAISLCRGAREFRAQCLSHVYSGLARTAPPADAPPARWARLLKSAEAARAALSEDPALAERFVDRLWAEALARSYAQVARVTGHPLDALPVEATPHVRAGAAFHLDQPGAPGRLADRVTALQRALASREAGGTAEPPRFVVDRRWTTLEPGDAGLPWVHFLGDARRVLVDGDADLVVCVLEAHARGPAPAARVLGEGLVHADARVRWTARRLSR